MSETKPGICGDALNQPIVGDDADISEEAAAQSLASIFDQADVVREGQGSGVLYAYGYRCAPDRLKIGITESDTVQRIAAQISTSTPDRPVLYIEIRTNTCRALERAVHGVLESRGRKVEGDGSEWFTTTRDDVLEIYHFISGTA